MKKFFAIFMNEKNEGWNTSSYDENTFVQAFEDETVAEHVAELLSKKVGYITQFGEERTFFVKEVNVNSRKSHNNLDQIVNNLEKQFGW